jgi:hypothetical protein
VPSSSLADARRPRRTHGRWSTQFAETKSHEQKFPQAERRGNCRVGYVRLGDGDLMVAFTRSIFEKTVQPAMRSLRRVGAAKIIPAFSMARKFLLSDPMFSGVKPPRAGKHGGSATCVDVMHHAVEGRRLGAAAAGTPQVVVVTVAGARRSRRRQRFRDRRG